VSITEQETFYWGLKADEAFAHFLAGERARAAGLFQDVVAAIEPLEPIINTEPVRSFHRRVMAVVTVANQVRDGHAAETEIGLASGLCSDLTVMRDEREQPGFDFLVLNLVMLGLDHPANVDLEHWAERVRRSRLLMVRAAAAEPLFRLAKLTGKFEHVIADGVRQLDALTVRAAIERGDRAAAFQETAEEVPTWATGAELFITFRIVASCFEAAARGEAVHLPIEQWRRDIPERAAVASICEAVDDAEKWLVRPVGDPWEAIRGHAIGVSERCFAALSTSMDERCPPERLLIAHAIWLLAFDQKLLRDETGPPVSRLVAAQWLGACDRPILLNSPRITVPAIREAIASRDAGWHKVHRILSAALRAVSLPSNHWVSVAIRAWATADSAN